MLGFQRERALQSLTSHFKRRNDDKLDNFPEIGQTDDVSGDLLHIDYLDFIIKCQEKALINAVCYVETPPSQKTRHLWSALLQQVHLSY